MLHRLLQWVLSMLLMFCLAYTTRTAPMTAEIMVIAVLGKLAVQQSFS